MQKKTLKTSTIEESREMSANRIAAKAHEQNATNCIEQKKEYYETTLLF